MIVYNIPYKTMGTSAKYNRSKGFTLIELLVVMSIVCVLASAVIASMNAARYQAKNARVAEGISQLRLLLEQTWTGTSYSAFAATPALGDDFTTSIVAPNIFTDPKITTVVNDILAQNGGQYGGESVGASSGCTTNPIYNDSFAMGQNAQASGLTIYVYPGGCLPTTKYAIYAAKAPGPLAWLPPLVQTAFANLLPYASDYSGYICIDSSGHATGKGDGWIPGYSGTWPSYTTTNVIDGLCH